MKSKEIHGKVNVSSVEKRKDHLIFHWESLEKWTNEAPKGKFFGLYRQYEAENTLELQRPELICWNNATGEEISFALDTAAVKQGILVAEDWNVKLDAYRSFTGRKDIYWVLRGEKHGRQMNYVLGGQGDGGCIFGRQELISNLRESDLCLYMVPRYTEEDKWLFRIVKGTRFLGALFDNEMIQHTLLKVSGFQWEENGLSVFLDAGENVFQKNWAVKEYLLHDEGTGEFYRGNMQFDVEDNALFFDESFCEYLKQLYEEKVATYRVKVFPICFDEEECVCYEFITQNKVLRESRYDSQWRTEDFTDFMEYEGEQVAVMPYYSKAGYLRFVVKKSYRMFTEMHEAHMRSIVIKNGMLRIRFSLGKSEYTLKKVSLILRSDIQDKSYDFMLSIKEKRKKLVVEGVLPVQDVEWGQFYWDIRGEVTRDGRDYELRLRNYSKFMKLKMLLAYQQVYLPGGEYLIFPYMTKSRDFAVTYRARMPQDTRAFMYREYLALFLYYLLWPYWRRKDIWLVYEKYSITAQDNSLYFFKYCMEQLPEREKKHIFYAIDKNASDYQYVKDYDSHVVQFLSLKHMIYLKAASLLVSSDTKAHAYAWHSPNSLYREMIKRNRNVFLQHGVIYYKKCHQGLRKRGTNSCRLFIVSSDSEKEIIQKYFGYNANEIAVTGLARWDVLEDRSVPGEKMILMMPTWRNWLEEVTEEQFKASDYYKNYMALLNSPKLHDFLKRKHVKMIFYIHPKFREYISTFATDCPNIQMIEFGTQPLNALLMRCNMMITDYSSACWDVFYQKKPVLFYLFDYELYDQVQGSYVDMRTQAFGDATDQMDELVDWMEAYEEKGFCEKEKYAKLREQLLPFRDHLNCDRTYEAIKKKFYT